MGVNGNAFVLITQSMRQKFQHVPQVTRHIINEHTFPVWVFSYFNYKVIMLCFLLE